MRKKTDTPLKVLYLVYWGAAEPLGQSLVLPAIRELAARGVALTLVTFEKPADLTNQALMEEIRADLKQRGVPWISLRYHKQPKVIFDVIYGFFYTFIIGLRWRPDVIHVRTFIAGLIGLLLAPALRAKWIYHNEGFFPDEQVDGGVWKQDSVLHRTFKFLEQKMYARAHGIIALSQRAKRGIETLPTVVRKKTPVIVVPSCVDLQRFQVTKSDPFIEGVTLRLVYVGSVGRRHLLDKIAQFAAVAVQEIGDAYLQVLSQTEKSLVNSMIEMSKLPKGKWSHKSIQHTKVAAHLKHQHAGLLFYPRGLSEHGGSPTKVGEYWACGLPVVTTPNVSDTDEIIRRERVGVVVAEHTDEAYRRAARELKELLNDPDLATRCRRAAEKYYALEPACDRQLALYQTVAIDSVQNVALPHIAEQ